MKNVVWGTGQYAGRFVATHGIADIDFFIDSDIRKAGGLFLGKRIIHPDQVGSWEDLFVYVPFNYYKEISENLQALGLKEGINFTKYLRIGSLSVAEAKRDYIKAVSELKSQKCSLFGKYLVWGVTWLDRKGIKDVLLQKENLTKQLALILEAVWWDRENAEIMAEIPTVIAPKIFETDRIYIRGDCHNDRVTDNFCTDSGFEQSVEHIKGVFQGCTDATLMANLLYKYIYDVIDELNPKGMLAECSFTTPHTILGKICRKKELPIIYTHLGLFPGTLSFDIGGEMGESLPARYPKEFCRLAVSNQELQEAKGVWDYLERSKLNRKIQPKNPCVSYIQSKRKPGRPILFFAGQNDPVSGMIPYTETTQKYHSPIFKSSLEAAIYLANLCEKNDWNFVFKPHPSYIQENMEELLPANTIYVETGDINDLVDASDVVITILSQTNYVALIRHRPVVMLGYNQTRGKGCTYEAFEKDKIEDTLREAIENGFTKEQQDAFQLHIAQVLKYYLYDDMSERELRYGRPAPHSFSEFYDLERLLKGHAEGNKASLSKSEGEDDNANTNSNFCS